MWANKQTIFSHQNLPEETYSRGLCWVLQKQVQEQMHQFQWLDQNQNDPLALQLLQIPEYPEPKKKNTISDWKHPDKTTHTVELRHTEYK